MDMVQCAGVKPADARWDWGGLRAQELQVLLVRRQRGQIQFV